MFTVPDGQLALFTWCGGPLNVKQRKRVVVVYEAETFEPTRSHLTFPHDPYRMGHALPAGAKLGDDGRCGVCDRLRGARTAQLTQSQRAIEAARCWQYVGGPPKPGRPRTRKPSTENASNEGGGDLTAENPLFGYSVSVGLMATRWGVSKAYVTWATVLVTRAPGQANAVRGGALNLKDAYEELLIQGR